MKFSCALYNLLLLLFLVPYKGQGQGQGHRGHQFATSPFLPLSYGDLIYSLVKRDYVQRQGSEEKPFSPLDEALALKRQLHGNPDQIRANELARTRDAVATALTNIEDQRIVQGCCWRTKIAFTKDHINGAYRLHPYVFGYYTMEPGLVNGRNHYSSEPDGRFVIAYCGDTWWVQSKDVRGQCRGWAHSGWRTEACVHDIEYSWRYYIPSVDQFVDADKGFSVWCKS